MTLCSYACLPASYQVDSRTKELSFGPFGMLLAAIKTNLQDLRPLRCKCPAPRLRAEGIVQTHSPAVGAAPTLLNSYRAP